MRGGDVSVSEKKKGQDNTVAPLPESLVRREVREKVRTDEFAGCGGSYARDAVTGERVLVARTMDRGEVVPAADKE